MNGHHSLMKQDKWTSLAEIRMSNIIVSSFRQSPSTMNALHFTYTQHKQQQTFVMKQFNIQSSSVHTKTKSIQTIVK